MSRIRSVNTAPEKTLRSLLHKSGFRFRIHYPVTGKPDLVFPSRKIAVFVHGCFWHRHRCKNSVIPKTNTEFWMEKLENNIKRDKKVRFLLGRDGWKVIRVWECEIEKNPEKIFKKIKPFL